MPLHLFLSYIIWKIYATTLSPSFRASLLRPFSTPSYNSFIPDVVTPQSGRCEPRLTSICCHREGGRRPTVAIYFSKTRLPRIGTTNLQWPLGEGSPRDTNKRPSRWRERKRRRLPVPRKDRKGTIIRSLPPYSSEPFGNYALSRHSQNLLLGIHLFRNSRNLAGNPDFLFLNNIDPGLKIAGVTNKEGRCNNEKERGW